MEYIIDFMSYINSLVHHILCTTGPIHALDDKVQGKQGHI